MGDNNEIAMIGHQESGERVLASEICLFCNLYDLFTKYSVYESDPTATDDPKERVLQPRQVRQALLKLNFDSVGGQDFVDGQMGCAQEAFERILGFLHRESVDPNYLERVCSSDNADSRWRIDDNLDNMGCTPKCAAHAVFGIQTLAMTSCERCGTTDDVSEADSNYLEQFYVHEMLAVFDKLA